MQPELNRTNKHLSKQLAQIKSSSNKAQMIVGDVKVMVDDIEQTVFTDAKYGAL